MTEWLLARWGVRWLAGLWGAPPSVGASSSCMSCSCRAVAWRSGGSPPFARGGGLPAETLPKPCKMMCFFNILTSKIWNWMTLCFNLLAQKDEVWNLHDSKLSPRHLIDRLDLWSWRRGARRYGVGQPGRGKAKRLRPRARRPWEKQQPFQVNCGLCGFYMCWRRVVAGCTLRCCWPMYFVWGSPNAWGYNHETFHSRQTLCSLAHLRSKQQSESRCCQRSNKSWNSSRKKGSLGSGRLERGQEAKSLGSIDGVGLIKGNSFLLVEMIPMALAEAKTLRARRCQDSAKRFTSLLNLL